MPICRTRPVCFRRCKAGRVSFTTCGHTSSENGRPLTLHNASNDPALASCAYLVKVAELNVMRLDEIYV